MIDAAQQTFLNQMYSLALMAANATSPWPLGISQHEYAKCAACESCQETGWGEHVPVGSKNVLGIKAFNGWTGATVGATGTEQSPDGTWSGPQADSWCVFPTYVACFAQQLHILQESRYSEAVAAKTTLGYDIPNGNGGTVHIAGYIEAECKVWSTGILKGQAVTQIYNAHAGGLV